jgi:lambda family phage tail tape measure protein
VSVVANVAINVDSSGAVSKLRQVQQGAQATSQAVDKLNATTAATSDKFKIAANGIKYFTDAAGRARAENGRFLTSTERAAAGIEAQGRAAQQASGKFKGLRNALASLGAGLAVRKAFVDASELESAQARIGLLTKNFSQLTGIQEVAANAAKKFNLSQAESLGTLTDLGNRIGPTGASLQDVANVYEGFNTLLALNKVNSQNAASATLQLNQALGSGRLAGEEFNAISEATPQLLDAVAKVLGRNRGELKQLASDGKISSQVLIEALTRIRTEGAADLETAFGGAFGATRRFNAALEDFSATIGTELLPALTPLINGATEILKLFGQLPGPVKTLIAAIAGLTAAFIALAPALTTAIGLLTAAQLAALVAAGPWIALAAGITAAAVALASYRTESEKIGAKAAKGDPAAMSAARGRMVTLEQEIALMKLEGAEKASPRSALGGSFANAKAEFARLKRDVTTGQTAATPTPTPTLTPTTGTGTGKGAGKGKDDAARIAEQIRASKLQLTLAQDIFAIEGRLQQAQLEGNKQLVLARNAQKELAQIASQRADIIANKEMPALEKKNVLDKLAIDAATVSGKLGFDLAKIEQDRTKSFDAIIADLNLELALKTATTEQERERLRIEAARAKLQADLKGQGFEQPQIDQITGLQAQVAAPLTDVQKIDQHIGKLKDEIADLTSISNIAITSAEGIGKAFAQSFQGLISGSMTAKEALGSFFKSVADMFLEMAAQIIAKQMTMIILQTILKALGGGAFSGGTSSAVPTDAAGWAGSFNTELPGITSIGKIGFAKGGAFSNSIVSSPTLFKFADGGSMRTGLMGEAGPEAIMPLKRGADGSLGVQANGLREAMNQDRAAGGGTPVLNMSFQSTTINGTEYVSRDQLEQAMAQTRRDASRDGAKRGMTMTLDKLQQSPSTRSRVGMR